MMGAHDECPGLPHKCAHSQECIRAAIDGYLTEERLEAARQELAHCPPCLHMLDFQVQFKIAMHRSCHTEAPEHLQIKITEAITRIRLGDLGVEDL